MTEFIILLYKLAYAVGKFPYFFFIENYLGKKDGMDISFCLTVSIFKRDNQDFPLRAYVPHF